MIKRLTYIIFFLSLVLCVSARSHLDYNVEVACSSSLGKYAPFWLVANRGGVSSLADKWGYVRMGADGATALKGDWSLEYGADIVGARNLHADVFVHQAYADVSWRWLCLSIGKKERAGELKKSLLSTGALIESSNAAPIPQVRLEVPEYRDFFGTNGWLGLRGHIAYGWFSDGDWQQQWAAPGTRYAQNVLYHSKALYWKVGKEQLFPLTYEGGVLMVAQFGGDFTNYMNNAGVNFSNPVRLKDFWDIFVFSAGDSQYAIWDQLNVAGNHLGSYHLALKWEDEGWALRGYYEHMFEDHSSMFWEYGLWKDCLAGAELHLKKIKWLDNILFEYFNSRDQSGPIYHDTTSEIPDQISASDDYMNHHTYSCWQHYGAIIGTPLLMSPLYNDDNKFEIYNNRVEAFHLGLSGSPLAELGYRVLLVKSYNWGTYSRPFKEMKRNLSGLFELSYTPLWADGFMALLSFAFDDGELYGNNKGVMFGIKKCGRFF
jgi:hypothetical protein